MQVTAVIGVMHSKDKVGEIVISSLENGKDQHLLVKNVSCPLFLCPPYNSMGYYVKLSHTIHTAFVDCGHPGNVTNGTVDVSEGTKLHATARYTCDEGTIINGRQSIICGSNGRWSGTTPTCEGATQFKNHIWW